MPKHNVSNFFKTMQTVLTKHTPEILTGIGIAGMVTTTVLAVKATPKAIELIKEKEKEVDGTLTGKEKIQTCWKCYIPAAVTGAASIGCLVGASSVHTRRNAVLATAYKLSETAMTEYKEKVIETIGEKKERTIRDKIAKDHVENNPVSKSEVIITGGGETLCHDYYSGRWFKSDIEKLRSAENDLNRMILNDDYASLNDWYDLIGLSSNSLGKTVGWNTTMKKVEMHISSTISDSGQPAIVVSFLTDPKHNFDKYW